MVDIKHTRCKHEGCTTHVTCKYKGYCCRCFIHLFPDSKISRNYKTKETHVCNFVKETFVNEDMVFDKVVQGGCSKRRPDILIDKYTHSIIIEIDENQHEDYDTVCENKRTMQLFQDLGHRPVVMIRFNPDDYINNKNKKVQSCFKYHKTMSIPIVNNMDMWNLRLNLLANYIEQYLKEIPSKEVTCINLFFDSLS